MALESLGTSTAKKIDLAFQLCHDLVMEGMDHPASQPEDVEFRASEHGMWAVFPSMLDGKPAVGIKIAVG